MIKKKILFLLIGAGLILSGSVDAVANGRSSSSERGSHAPRGADRGGHEGQKNNDLLYGPRRGAYTVDGSGGDTDDDYDDDDDRDDDD